MKKFIACVAIGCISLPSLSQTPVDYDYTNKKVIFPAIKKELTKDDKYGIFMPSRLGYFTSQDEILNNIWSPFLSPIEVKARVHQVKYDYRFDVVSPGIQKVTLQGVAWYKTEVLDQNNIPREVKGYIRNYTCTFPCALIIRNAEGKMLDSIVISGDDDVYTTALHRDFLSADNRGNKQVIPFGSAEEITRLEAMTQNQINKKIEQITGAKVFYKLALDISYLFKNYNTYKQIYGYGFIKVKGGQASSLPELDKVVSDYKIALDSLNEGNFEFCTRTCENNRTVMEKLLSSNDARVDKNIKEIIYYNLSHANALSGNFADAWKYYQLFIGSGVSEQSRLAGELRGRISQFEGYSKIKKQVKS